MKQVNYLSEINGNYIISNILYFVIEWRSTSALTCKIKSTNAMQLQLIVLCN